MTTPHVDPLDELLRGFSTGEAPEAVTGCLTEQLRSFRQRLADRDVRAPASMPARIWLRWSWPAAAVAALALLAIAVYWTARPNTSLAQAAAETMQQPWIHIIGKVTGGFDREIWFSVPHGFAAGRFANGVGGNERIEFHDFANKTRYTFNAVENAIFKTSDRDLPKDRQKELQILERIKDQLLAGKPLADLDFMGGSGGWKIVDQISKTVVEDRHELIEVRLEATPPESKQPAKIVFRLDPQARLLRQVTFEGDDRGKAVSGEYRFEYPQKGPADIFALGVPKTATLIDTTPAGVQQIVDQHRADIQRMDAYRAVAVQQILDDQGNDCQWINPPEALMEHKGDWYRSSRWSGSLRDGKWSNSFSGYKTPYKKGDDPRSWWLDRIHDLTFCPSYITREGMDYQCEGKTAQDARGKPQTTITSVQSSNNWPAVPTDYSQRPEFACRPPMGVGGETHEPSLELKPEGGPPGCVLLRQRRLVRDQDPNQRPGTKSGDLLFWLDPARDYVAVRWEETAIGPDGKEFVATSYAMEDMAKSPSGVWYAKRVRVTGTMFSNGQETKMDNLYDIHVDFDAKLPDELFAVPVVGASVPSGP